MNTNDLILNNFKVYDKFLVSLKDRDRKILTSLKMMYCVHMQNITKNKVFVLKQLIRFLGKILSIPFYTVSLEGVDKQTKNAILENTNIENDISNMMVIPTLSIKRNLNINYNFFMIYKKLFRVMCILLKDSSLNKIYIFSLIHRIIDYLMVYETLNINKLQLLLIENDRLPSNLALIHLLQDNKKVTIKYDNWLIDPINHNDVYCDYYYYPSIYHKNIIESFSSNKQLKYIKGGFLHWDKLYNYTDVSNKRIINIIYFTQLGISKKEQLQYISDIIEVLKLLNIEFLISIKIHPREKTTDYKEFKDISTYIKIINISEDIYTLITKANYCFSVFSTISIEAKHIINNSYFINYNSDNFTIIDYDKINLDLINNKDVLYNVLKKEYIPVIQKEFLNNNNCTFPNTKIKLQRFIDDINNNTLI
ncbi:MAG: hypothetical protein DRG78_03140 [Epsilonproteobacteria bacterium]|nr:MAG: hypothetical protein DRG78_03140 [Campylobacterota bacterium]